MNSFDKDYVNLEDFSNALYNVSAHEHVTEMSIYRYRNINILSITFFTGVFSDKSQTFNLPLSEVLCTKLIKQFSKEVQKTINETITYMDNLNLYNTRIKFNDFPYLEA